MHSTIQPPPLRPLPAPAAPSPAEFLAEYTLKIHRAQSDALDILQRIMIQAARLLQDPPLEKPYQTRTTNERMRIAMRSAATIINMRLPELPGTPPLPPLLVGEGAQGSARADEGALRPLQSSRKKAAQGSAKTAKSASNLHHQATASPLPSSAQSSAPPRDSSLIARDLPFPPPSSIPPLPSSVRSVSSVFQAPFSPLPSPLPLPFGPLRFGPLHDPPLPPSAPSASSVFQAPLSPLPSPLPLPFDPLRFGPLHTPPLPSSVPSVPSVVNSLSPPPPDLTFEERASIYMTQRGVKAPPMPSIAAKLRAWHLHTEATGIKPSFDATPESLLPPPRPKRKRAAPRAPPPHPAP